MKVKLFDKRLIQKFYGALSVIGTLTSLLLIFMDIPLAHKRKLGLASLVLLVVYYICIWYKSNYITSEF